MLIARGACLAVALYFAAGAVFALVHGDQFASALPQLLRYVIIPSAIALALAVTALKARPRRVGMIAATALSIMAALFLFEALITLGTYSAVAGLVSVPDEAWMRRARLDRGLPPSRTAKGLNAALGVGRLQDAFLGGVPGQAVLLCSDRGRHIAYRADRFGFNNPDHLHDGQAELLIVGDSFVEGICLRPGRDLVGRTRASLPTTIALGHRGAGPLMELAMLGRFGRTVRAPHVAVVFFEGNDWENLQAELNMPWLRESLLPGAEFGPPAVSAGMLERAEGPIASWLAHDRSDIVEVVQRTKSARNFLALNHAALALGLSYPRVAAQQRDYAVILKRAREIVGSWGGDLLLVYVPQSDRFRGIFRRDFVYDQVRDKVVEAARQAKVPLIDLTSSIDAGADPLAFYDEAGGHFSEAGAKLAGDAIADWALRRRSR